MLNEVIILTENKSGLTFLIHHFVVGTFGLDPIMQISWTVLQFLRQWDGFLTILCLVEYFSQLVELNEKPKTVCNINWWKICSFVRSQ